MARLKSHEKYIPGGFRFFQPETGWKSRPNASFEVIVMELIAHRKGNAFLAQKHKWSTDPDQVRDEVDRFNATICEQMGWNDYIQAPTGGAPPAFFPSPSPQDQRNLSAVAEKVKNIWAGVRTLNDWLDSGEPPVDSALSTKRAAVCAVCPKNTPGDFTHWFTKPAAEVIKKQLEKLYERKLSTPDDDRLNVCNVCLCPMRLKVHAPMSYINQHMTDDTLNALEQVPNCWIVAERKA